MTSSETAARTIYHQTVTLLEELCAISSPSGDADGLRLATDRLAEALERRGLAVAVTDEPDADSVPLPVLRAAGTTANQTGSRPLLAVGHLDTVLSARPPEIEGHVLRGTGSADMKAGLAALVGALDVLAERGESSAADDLLLVVVPDEEVAGPISHRVMEQHGPDACGLWVLEPGQPGPEGSKDASAETVVIGRRGMFQWHADVHGRSAHAGNGYWQGRSAATAAARWWLECQALVEPGPGPTVNAGRLVAGEAEFVDDIVQHGDLLGSNRQVNVVPDRARIEGEARFLSAEDGRRVAGAMESAARRVGSEAGTRIEFVIGTEIRPLEATDASRQWARRAAELAATAGWTLRAEDDRRGISFSNFLPTDLSIPILDGLGPVGGGLHTRDEYVDLRSLERRIVLLADLLEALKPRR